MTARILIVDDEVAQTKALCDTLNDQGYETVGVAGGEAALVALKGGEFDLLLADLMMPGMNGISLLKAAFELDSSIVGIIMTGDGTITTAVEAMKTGALDYILKPFKLSQIIPVLERALTVRRLQTEKLALERNLRTRTSELEAAYMELEATNAELEAFTYSVSHDLRAPLRFILGFSTILVENHSTQVDDEVKDLVQDIVSSAKNMDELIEALLRLSRAGRQQLVMQPINLSELVTAIVHDLRAAEGDRQVVVNVGDLLDTVGDATLIGQVFVNLLTNAFKFTAEQLEAVVDIGYELAGDECIYYVRDNGAGFDMAYVDKLFGVFQRLHSRDRFEGTGIGLSIVQRIVQRHGGRIWAEAQLNKGATFFFTLPAIQ